MVCVCLLQLVLTDPVDGDRRTVLHYCVQNRSTRLAALVIERDESIINAAEANGHTPLQLSVIAGNLPMAEYLLKSGADINRADKNQHSVAHWAVGRWRRQAKMVPGWKEMIGIETVAQRDRQSDR